MLSRFGKSIGLILKRAEEDDVYTTSVDKEFKDKYLGEEYPLPHDNDSDSLDFNYYLSQSITLRSLCLVENILDQIEYGGITNELAESLLGTFTFLRINSSNTLIYLDDGFSYEKKYTLINDASLLASSLRNISLILEDFSKRSLPGSNTDIIPKYKELEARACCKYIRSSISVVKLFHILAILQTSPYYSDDTHQIAKLLIQSLREILYNKRILNVTVDADTKGASNKLHKSTRLKILFALKNSDRYCIRLDFPHEGVDCIHLNLNEPARKHSAAFPFGIRDIYEAKSICEDEEMFDSLFYLQDDLYWFRSNYSSQIKEIDKTDIEKGRALEQFHSDRVHVEILPPDAEHKKAVSEFSEAFAEAMAEFGFRFNYDSTDSEDDTLYRYLHLHDAIFDIVSELRSAEISSQLGISLPNSDIILDKQDWDILEPEIKKELFKRIGKTFSDDKALLSYMAQDPELEDFFSKCLDRFDELGL